MMNGEECNDVGCTMSSHFTEQISHARRGYGLRAREYVLCYNAFLHQIRVILCDVVTVL